MPISDFVFGLSATAALISFLAWPDQSQASNVISSLAAGSSRQCALFSDGVQENAKGLLHVTNLSPTLLRCRLGGVGSERIATRRLAIGAKGGKTSYLLMVDPATLASRIERESCLKCEPIQASDIATTKFAQAIAKSAQDYRISKEKPYLVAAGLKRGAGHGHGSVVSADLCPSHKPLEREFFADLEGLQAAPAPIALAVSGRWIQKHQSEFIWLKNEVTARRLSVTWVNHSYRHAVSQEQPEEQNYLLMPGTDFNREILKNEQVMIENGITPSVFFRFPALVSSKELMISLKEKMLIPLSADAWLAKGQIPRARSIVLVHANGNEPRGISIFKKMIADKRLPLPLLPLSADLL